MKRKILFIWIMVTVVLGTSSMVLAQEEITGEELLFMKIPIVVTAAKKEQPVSESPAVVTVITAEDIKQTGARTLMDVLRTVPGFNILQDTNEHLTVMRGIYASTNQKLLLLRDGHRINEWMWNSAEHDYCLSLDNVERIEIIRGPGASLYGSAALCAVVNIITLDGKEVDGLKVTAGAGIPSQSKHSVLYGRDYKNGSDLLLWGSLYGTDGEKAEIIKSRDGSSIPVDGYEYIDKRGLNYDLGIKLKEDKWTFSGSLQNSDYFNPRGNAGQLFEHNISYIEDFKQIFRVGHLDLLWEDASAGNPIVKLRHYWDYFYWFSWQMLAPQREYAPWGKMFSWDVEGYSYGFDYSVNYPLGNGNLILGFQPEQRELVSSNASRNYSTVSTSYPVVQVISPIREGSEYYIAGYAQFDQKLADTVLVNTGFRYDYYKDVGGSLNPRIACIFSPFNEFYWKFIYGRAFLNPSYFYRYVTGIMGYYGGPDLKPEIMDSYQTEISKCYNSRESIRVGYFYNITRDLVAPDKSVPGRYTYKNYGTIVIQGIETEFKSYLVSGLEFFVNHTYQKPVEGETDPEQMKDGTIKNVPENTANIGINYEICRRINLNVSSNWHGKIESPAAAGSEYGPDYEIPEAAIINTALTFSGLWRQTELSLVVNNLLNKEHYLGGTTLPYRQPGRWVLVNAGYKF